MNFFAFTTSGLCLIACLLFSSAAQAEENVSILSAEGSSWAAYYEAGDLDGLMTLYMDDVVVFLHGQPGLYGKEAVRNFFAPRIGTAATKFELEYELQEIHGNIAYIVSKYWMRVENKETGTVFKDAGRSLLVYKNVDGQGWKIAADIDQASPDVGWPSPAGLD
jgi:ketosteroid isomerase-like protein